MSHLHYASSFSGNAFPSTENLGQGGDDYSNNPYSAPKGGNPSGEPRKDGKLNNVQQQVDEVVNIMQENINKVMEREERLDNVHDKTQRLQGESDLFRRGATQTRKKMAWRNMKLKIIIGIVLVILIIVIVVPVVVSQRQK